MQRTLFFLAASILLAQEPRFTVDTKLVVINVSVKDKSGRPITTLQKEDFQVLEDGVPQNITVFELQQLSAEPLTPVSFAQRPQTIEERAANVAAGISVTTQSPAGPKRYRDRRLIGLFFDLSSMQELEQARAQ